MTSRNIDGEQNIFGISIGWRGAGNPENRDGGPGGGNAEGKTDAEVEAEDRKEEKHRRTMVDHGKELLEHSKRTMRQSLGINVGVASLLKQSQLFTGTLGTIFQILGAMVDVVLAAFMPLIIPALKTMANSIPQIQEKAEQIKIGVEKFVEWLKEINERIKNHPVVKWLKSTLGTLLQYWLIGVFIAKITGLWTPFWALHKVGVHGTLKLLGVIAREVGMMRLHTQVQASSGQTLPGLFSVGRGKGKFGTAGLSGMGRGTAAMGVLGIGAGIAGGAAMGGAAGAGGAVGGAVVGGAIGSFLPGIGSMLGATAGSVIGGMLVSFFTRDRAEQQAGRLNTEADLYDSTSNLADRTSPNSQYSRTRRLG